MKIWINGEPHEVPSGATLPEVITHLGLLPQTLLVEHNGLALRRDEWIDRPIQDGDRLELLRIAAGG